MLEIRYGCAVKPHENEFFREFAQSLKGFFYKRGEDGLLLGFPLCIEEEKLQPDALLITSRTMTIIDFKNYDSHSDEPITVFLPPEKNFKHGVWDTSVGLPVKGGKSPNPFCQLGLQKKRLIKLIGPRLQELTKFNPAYISTMVCFTKPVELAGSIPGFLSNCFFIADGDSYLTKIFDITNIGTDRDLLNGAFIGFLNNEVFQTEPYECFLDPASYAHLDAPSKAPENEKAIAAGDDIHERIATFMEDDEDVLIITGTVGSGKDALADVIRRYAFGAGFASAPVFAPSSRIRDNLQSHIDDVENVFTSLFDYRNPLVDDEGRKYFPLNDLFEERFSEDSDGFDDIADQGIQRSVFIVYEGQMVSDAYRNDGNVRYGSGRLLSDLLSYLSLNGVDKTNKIVFVGDRFTFGAGPWDRSSLNPAAYSDELSVSTLELPDNPEPNGIERNCIALANGIRNGVYTSFDIECDAMVQLVKPEEKDAFFRKVAEHWSTYKMITHSNICANESNEFIKRAIIRNGETIAPGDLLVFTEQARGILEMDGGLIGGREEGVPITIANGSFALVETIEEITTTEEINVPGSEEPIRLGLVKVKMQLASSQVVTVDLLVNCLYGDRATLSEQEQEALRIQLVACEAEEEKRFPFAEGDPDFDEMIRAGEYKLRSDGRYRDRDDVRKLTRFENRHRTRNRERLLANPHSDYYRWMNAAKVRYGWCLTVHRAMSYTWPHVFFSVDYSYKRESEDFYRYLYTAFSRATASLAYIG